MEDASCRLFRRAITQMLVNERDDCGIVPVAGSRYASIGAAMMNFTA